MTPRSRFVCSGANNSFRHLVGVADGGGQVGEVLAKARFWRTWHTTAMNPRQIEMLNRILDGFNGKLTTRTWAIITRTSQASALRDINELIDLGALRRSDSSGRSTSYELIATAGNAAPERDTP